MGAMFILYVADQDRSEAFYAKALQQGPSLSVPGMTEFDLGGGATLGLMPSKGIRRLLGDVLPDPEKATGIPRAELYLRVEDAERQHRWALDAGAVELSPLADRDWGDRAAYSMDPDGHVLVFAEPLPRT